MTTTIIAELLEKGGTGAGGGGPVGGADAGGEGPHSAGAWPRRMEANAAEILAATAGDVENVQEKKTNAPVDRLLLNEKRVAGMAEALREIARFTDPVGEVIAGWRLPNGLEITKVRVPLGVVGIIYESRPNVTVDAAGLCLKSGNAAHPARWAPTPSSPTSPGEDPHRGRGRGGPAARERCSSSRPPTARRWGN